MNEIIEIKNMIYTIRGQKVMIDRDLAELYGVGTKVLNQAVKRNIMRFPSDFMFQLTDEEQNEVVTNCDHLKKLKYSYQNAYAFTEHGVTMLASVLNSQRAIEINVQIVRAFVKLRQFALENKELTQRLAELEKCFIQHCKDNQESEEHIVKAIYNIQEAINLLMDRTKPNKIGFVKED